MAAGIPVWQGDKLLCTKKGHWWKPTCLNRKHTRKRLQVCRRCGRYGIKK